MTLPLVQLINILPPLSPRTSLVPEDIRKSWSRNSVIYQVYPRSFNDSDNDGVGDIPGVTQKLDYLQELGIGAIWLNPFFKSPMADFGYDISDYCEIDPTFGTFHDFEKLVNEAHSRGIKIIIDFVANHTSVEHPWFLESKSSRFNKKHDWYIWKDPKPDGSAPNNWEAVFGGSAWEFVPERGQYYLHSFLKQQPDLNWRNPEVQQAMFRVVDFWLEKGVDGIRIDAAHHILKDELFRDEPLNPDYHPTTSDKPWHRFLHPFMRERPETPEFLANFSDFAGKYGDKYIIPEARIPIPDMVKYMHASKNHRLSPLALSFRNLPVQAKKYKEYVDEFESKLEAWDYPTYVLADHDYPHRLPSRVGQAKARMLAVMLLTLRGMPIIYYGDEIGMEDAVIPADQVKDNFAKNTPGLDLGRDAQRTPMQWDDSLNAGFSDTKPWLPVSPSYKSNNVQNEKLNPTSTYNLYKTLLQFRNNSETLKHGIYLPLDFNDPDIFGYIRSHNGERFLILLNFAKQEKSISLSKFSRHFKVILSSTMDLTPHQNLKGYVDLSSEEGVIIKL